MHRRKVFYKKICFYDLWIFILLGLQNLLIYFEPIMVKQFIDKLFNLPNIKLSDYLFLIIFFCCDFIFCILSISVLTRLLEKIYYFISDTVFYKYQTEKPAKSISYSSGEIITLLNNDINSFFAYITQFYPKLIVEILFVTFALRYIKIESLNIFLLCIIASFTNIIIALVISKKNSVLSKISREKLKEKQDFIVYIHERYSYIYANKHNEYMQKEFGVLNKGFYSISAQAARAEQFGKNILRLITILTQVIAAFLFVIENKSAAPSIGGFLAIQLMIGNIFAPVSNILNSIILISSKRASIQKIFLFLNGYKENTAENGILFSKSEYELYFNKPAFYLIEGANGIGKSSLLKNFAGILNIKINTQEESKTILRKDNINFSVSYHSPEALIISGTVLENIMLSSNIDKDLIINYKNEKIQDIVKQLGGFKRKFDWASENLSSGEKLLIELLRIEFSDKDIYLIDEISAHLDIKNKKNLIDILFDKVEKGKIVFYISHNESEKQYIKTKNCVSIILTDKIYNVY